jgi:hypothetical protein
VTFFFIVQGDKTLKLICTGSTKHNCGPRVENTRFKLSTPHLFIHFPNFTPLLLLSAYSCTRIGPFMKNIPMFICLIFPSTPMSSYFPSYSRSICVRHSSRSYLLAVCPFYQVQLVTFYFNIQSYECSLFFLSFFQFIEYKFIVGTILYNHIKVCLGFEMFLYYST